jgi:hypothetical protein
MLQNVLLQLLLAHGQISTLVASKSLHAIVHVEVFSQIDLRAELLTAPGTKAFEHTRPHHSVSLHVSLEVLKSFDSFTTVAASEETNRVLVVLVRLDGFQIFARVRAVCDVAFERPLVRVPDFVLLQLTLLGEKLTALVAYELLDLRGPFWCAF